MQRPRHNTLLWVCAVAALLPAPMRTVRADDPVSTVPHAAPAEILLPDRVPPVPIPPHAVPAPPHEANAAIPGFLGVDAPAGRETPLPGMLAPAASRPPTGLASGEYRIHTGDWLIISIPYETDTRMEVPVRPDGRITYLFNIEVMAAGLTYRQLHAELIRELSRYYKAPAVTVVAKSFAGNAVYVMGPVLRPGAHTIQNDSRLLEVLSSAGVLNLLPQMTGDENYTSPVRDVVDLKGAYIARGDRIMEVNFEELIIKGDMQQNIPLQPRDFIFIPSSYLTNFQKRVYVCGQVHAPKVYRYTGPATLVEAVSQAGGPITNVADWRNCFLIRRENRAPVRIDYLAVVKGGAEDPALEDGDIVYFPERSLRYGSRAVTTVISEILAPLQAVLDADTMTKKYHQRDWGVNGPVAP